jgi:large subunit ribosomal protein L24
MLVDPASGQTTRTGRKLDDKGKLQRFAKKTGQLIK